jgi:hypothetical protein
MKIKKIENGYADINEKYLIYEFDEKWNVYKNKGDKLEFIWKFNTLEEAKKFVNDKVR